MAERNLNIIIKATDEATQILSRVDSSVRNTASSVDSSSNRMSKSIAGIKTAWVQLGAVVASSAWLVAGIKKSYEAEIAFNKLRIQVDALGMSYKTHESIINDAIAATSRYAIVQDEDVAAVLQQLVLHTGNLTQSMQNLNLVYDLAYMKGVDVATASTIVGKAMAGNIEGLGRLFPELKNVDELMGKYASTADKAAYAQAFFREKVANASSQMTEHELAVKRVRAAYEDSHQFIGGFIISQLDKIVQGVGAVRDVYNELSGVLDSMAAKINPNIVVIKKSTEGLMDYEKAKLLVGSAHEKTADQIAAATKKESDAVEAQLERIKKLVVPEGGGSLMALVWGDLDVPAFGEKAELVGIEIGGKLAAGFAAAGEEQETDPFVAATGDLDYNQKYITRLEWDQAYWEQYWAMQDENFNREEEFERMALDRNLARSQEEFQAKSQAEQQILNMKFNAANQAIALMSIVGQKNKAMAMAALVFQKGLAIAQTFIATEVAAASALAPPPLGLGPVAGAPLAATIKTMGYISMGLIAATGIAEAAMSGGSSSAGGLSGVGGGGGVGALPITAPNIADERGTQTITLIIQNPLNGQIADSAAESIIDLINRGGNMNYKIDAKVIQAN